MASCKQYRPYDLVDQFMKLKVSEEFWQMFLVVIQLGAVLAVVVLILKIMAIS